MAQEIGAMLARMDARMERNMEVLERMGEATQTLQRQAVEALKMILDRLTPAESDGPDMGELMAELVSRVGTVDQRTRRILTRVDAIAHEMPADIVRHINGEKPLKAQDDEL